MRQDLLALTPDDLVLLANRGLVKRAQQELQSGDLQCTFQESADGTVTAQWSDGVTCTLPGGKPANAGLCTCPATTICRHLLRSVLAYQQHAVEQSGPTAAPPAQPWNPGAISDEAVNQHIVRNARTWAHQAFAAGQVIELVRSTKPTAYCHSLACTVRFLVPGDLRYTHCDCAEPAPCRHVPLAVWAFRMLGEEQVSGIVETATTSPAVPAALLDELDAALRELVIAGIAGAPQTLIERLRRLEIRLQNEGLVWPANTLADLLQQHTAYQAHDARFTPALLSTLIGELCVRSDAIRANTGAVPQLFVRGAAADRETSMGTARLIGLGCGVQLRRGGVELAAYLQDADSGALVVLQRSANDPASEQGEPLPFWQLAQLAVAKGAGITAFGSGQALVKGGKRLPNGLFLPGRAQIALHPQAYAWESLRAPVFAEDFAELAARLAAQPPAALGPRRLSAGLYVCAIAGVEKAGFIASEQIVQATLRDNLGGRATMVHPYTNRGHAGVEALLHALAARPDELRYLAGHVRLAPSGLVIAPTALVFGTGATRSCLLPWVAAPETGSLQIASQATGDPPVPGEPLADYWAQLHTGLADLLVPGLGRADERQQRRWRELARQGGALGFGRSVEAVERLAQALEEKAATLHWNAGPAAGAVLELACLTLLASDALVGE
jgi:hypothetical protein